MARTITKILEDYKKLQGNPYNQNEADLNQRLALLNELQATPPETQVTFNNFLLADHIKSQIPELTKKWGVHNVPVSALNQAADFASSRLSQGSFDPEQFAAFVKDRSGGRVNHVEYEQLKEVAKNIAGIFQPGITNGAYAGTEKIPLPIDVNAEIASIHPALEPILAKKAAEQKVQDQLTAFPGQQNQAISDLDMALRASQGKFFDQTLSPQIIDQLNARGILDSGSLAEAFAKSASQLNTVREAGIAPLRSNVANQSAQMNYENALRGALESGRSLTDAVAFARALQAQTNQNNFIASQNDLNRSFSNEQMNQERAFELALAGRQQGPSGLDYFLNYGLPFLSTLGGAAISGWAGADKAAGGTAPRRQKSMFLNSQYGNGESG